MKKLLPGVLLLLGLSASQAWGQVYLRPPTSPYYRQPFAPFSPYYGGRYAYPGVPPGYPYSAPGYGVPGAPTTVIIDPTGQRGIATDTGENITGHPTRFFSFSQYFFNQGGGTTILGAGQPAYPGLSPQPGIGVFGIIEPGRTRVGIQPPRGRTNVTRPR